MKSKINVALLKNLQLAPVNHGNGLKQVFLANEEMSTKLTQIAFGTFQPKESCESHVHKTMNEYFYFIKGYGKYIIKEEVIDIEPGTFLEIPAGKKHMLLALGSIKLEFVYWGVAL